jgi:hypothetical protein
MTTTGAEAMELDTFEIPMVSITYADGHLEHASEGAMLGTHPVIVVDGLRGNLVSPLEMLDAGGTLTLDRGGGHIENADGSSRIPIQREGATMRVAMEDVRDYRNSGASTTFDHPGTLPLSHVATKAEIEHGKMLLARWTAVTEQAHPALATLTYLLDRRSKFLIEKEVMVKKSESEPTTEAPVFTGRSGGIANIYCRISKTGKLSGAAVMQRYIELHEHTGHQKAKVMRRAVDGVNGGRPAWKNAGLTSGQINKCAKLYNCPTCVLNRKRSTIPVNVQHDPADVVDPDAPLSSRTAKPGEIISMDPCGPVTPAAQGKYPYWFLFKDVATGMDHTMTATNLNTETWKAAVVQTFDWYRSYGVTPKILRCDADRIPLSNDFKKWLLDTYGARVQHSLPYTHYQNAVERDVQTVVTGVASLMYGQHWLRADCWDLALFHFVDCRNKTPHANSRDGLSPWQTFTKEQLDFDLEKRFQFGDLVAVGLPGNLPGDGKSWKFDMRNEVGIYVGDPADIKRGALVYWPYTHGVSERMHMFKLDMTDAQFMRFYSRKMDMLRSPLPYGEIAGAVMDFSKFREDSGGDDPGREAGLGREYEVPLQDVHDELPEHRTPPALVSDRVLRSSKPHVKAVSVLTVGDYLDAYGAFLFDQDAAASVSKTTVRTALQSEASDHWRAAIIAEVMSLIQGGTLQAIAGDPIGLFKLIHSTAQLKLKEHQDGSIDKYKARLCACGNELYGQVLETYSPTVGALAYSAVHQIAIIDGMERCIVDVVQAYLYQSYPEDALPLFLVLPDNVSDVCGLTRGVKYRIRKYLYGLPDAGLAYYKAYSAHLEAGGFQRTVSDPCLFVKLEDSHRTYVWTHVDDTFVCTTDPAELERFQAHCRKRFDITVSARVEEYLGIKLSSQTNGDVVLTQPKLLGTLEAEFKEQLASHRRATAPQRLSDDQSTDETPMSQTTYLHLLGALIYLTKSRPDISTAVSFGATHAACPTLGHFEELLHCLSYLLRTRSIGLRLVAGERNRSLKLKCYVDASYLTHADSKSHSGYCMSFGEIGYFYSKSSKQQLVTTSSTHAEMRALYSLAVDIVYLVHLCEELGRSLELPCIVMVDNQPVIDLIHGPFVKAKRCKHFLMLVNWVRERVEYGYFELAKVGTADNVADILTKIITGGNYTTKAHLLLG